LGVNVGQTGGKHPRTIEPCYQAELHNRLESTSVLNCVVFVRKSPARAAQRFTESVTYLWRVMDEPQGSWTGALDIQKVPEKC